MSALAFAMLCVGACGAATTPPSAVEAEPQAPEAASGGETEPALIARRDVRAPEPEEPVPAEIEPSADCNVAYRCGDGAEGGLGGSTADGPDGASPPPASWRLDLGSMVAEGGLSTSEVTARALAHAGAIRSCFERSERPAAPPRVRIALSIDTAGTVSSVDTSDPATLDCIARIVRRMRFPSASAPTTLTFVMVHPDR